MRVLLPTAIVVLAAGAVAGALWTSMDHAPSADPVRGRYVEARSAAVFAGACHFNGEVEQQGREAVLGFHLMAGTWDGVSLAGVDIAAAVASSQNLRDGAVRRSVVYIDADLADSTRRAAESWLRARHGAALGEVLAVRTTDVEVDTSDGVFHMRAGDRIDLAGAALPDRSCCKIPEDVWYSPLASGVGTPLVGVADACSFAGDLSLQAWSHVDQNNAFVGCFREPCADDAAAS